MHNLQEEAGRLIWSSSYEWLGSCLLVALVIFAVAAWMWYDIPNLIRYTYVARKFWRSIDWMSLVLAVVFLIVNTITAAFYIWLPNQVDQATRMAVFITAIYFVVYIVAGSNEDLEDLPEEERPRHKFLFIFVAAVTVLIWGALSIPRL